MKKEKLQETVNYILTWLCYGDSEAAARVAYTADEKALEDHDVIIVPNGHLGYSIVLPEMDRVRVEQPAKGKAIIRTDIVYNTFFFASRAEETFNTERDEHNRFAAKFSILGHNNRLQIPMLDEHARLLLKMLNLPLPSPGFGHIYLTHDVDTISQYRRLRSAVGGLKRGEKEQVIAAIKDIHNDPFYTFPWITEQDAKVPGAKKVYFIKHTEGKGYDYPQYKLRGKDYKSLQRFLKENGACFGVHSSYYGEVDRKMTAFSTWHRSHYLRGSLSFFKQLEEAGFTDDFTMGFADEAGFRLQTTRAIRFINPVSLRVTNLTLHPLTVMDCTLSNENYMNLSEDEAYFLCERLIAKVKMHHGDLCLLWHNNILTKGTYHKSLYSKLLELLK